MPRGRPKKVQMLPEADIQQPPTTPYPMASSGDSDLAYARRRFLTDFIFECVRKHPSLPSPEAMVQIADRAKVAAELVFGK